MRAAVDAKEFSKALDTVGKALKKSSGIEIEGRSDTAIGFNLNYLADALRQFKGEPRVRMKLGFPTFPVILEAEGRNDCAMVLPVRLSGNMAA